MDPLSVCRALLKESKLKLKGCVSVADQDKVIIVPPSTRRDEVLFALHSLKLALPNVVVTGLPDCGRAVINDTGGGTYNLLVEGNNFLGVMGTLGVDGTRATSNHIVDVEVLDLYKVIILLLSSVCLSLYFI